MDGWRVCPWCPEGDNEWPPECFTAAGSSYSPGNQPCNACFTQRFPLRHVNCAGCGERMRTRGSGDVAYHRRCRPPGVGVRRARRRCCRCGKEVMSTTAKEGATCMGCKRARWGFPRDRPMDRKAYNRIHFRRRYAAAREE